jgi:hypothetical protein
MYLDVRTAQARDQESYPCCGFLNLVGPANTSKRLFIDEACVVLLSVLTSEEILTEVYWPCDRKCDARDVMDWYQRWGAWLPDDEGQLRFWSIFMDCEQMETLYRYVHAMVRQCYLEILERHRELGEDYKRQEETEDWNQDDLESLPNFYPVPEEIIYYHPRLFLDGRAFWLTEENAMELRDWAYDAFRYWHKTIDKDQKEALVRAAVEADRLCPEKRWPE